MYGRTDLADLYRDRLTLRQVLVRIQALPEEAPLSALIAAQQAEHEAALDDQITDQALAPFLRG